MTDHPVRNTALTGANGAFVAELHARYLENRGAVDAEWAAFFAEIEDEAPEVLRDLAGASWAPRGTRVVGAGGTHPAAPANGTTESL